VRRSVLVLTWLTASCASPARAPEAELTTVQANQALADYWNRYREMVLAGDASRYGAMVTDDVVLTYTGGPTLRGRDQAAGLAAEEFNANKYTELHIMSDEVQVVGSRLFQLGGFHEAYTHEGKDYESYGRFGALFVSDSSGSWQVERLVGVIDSVASR